MQIFTPPIIIANFPWLIIVPLIIFFVISIFIAKGLINIESPWLSHIRMYWKIYFLFPIILSYIIQIAIASLAMADIIPHMFAESLILAFGTIFYGLVLVGLGILLGLVLSFIYISRGTSFLMLTWAILLLPVFWLMHVYNPSSMIEFILDELSTIIFFIIIMAACGQSPTLLRLMGVDASIDEKLRKELVTRNAMAYTLKAYEKLKKRVEVDGDPIAQEAIRQLQMVGGLYGEIIRRSIGLKTDASEMKPHETSITDISNEMMRVQTSGLWTLTRQKFDTKRNINRILYIVLSVVYVLFIVQLYQISTLFQIWSFVLLGGMMLFSIPLLFYDPLFIGGRMSANNIVRTILRYFRGMDAIISDLDEVFEATPETESIKYDEQIQEPSTETFSLVSEVVDKIESKETRSFVERTLKRKDDVYPEDYTSFYLFIISFIVVLASIFLISLVIGLRALVIEFFWLLPTLIISIGLGLAVYWYHSSMKRSFFGMRRGPLSLAISYLSLTEAGVDDLGLVAFPPPPQPFIFISVAGPRHLAKFQSKIASSLEIEENQEVSVKSLEVELKTYRAMIPLIVVLIPIFLLTVNMFGMIGVDFIFVMIFILVAALILFGTIPFALYKWYQLRKIRDAKYNASREPTISLKTAQVINLLREQYNYPLRLLLAFKVPRLFYTGNEHYSTKGVKLYEALFIPEKDLNQSS